jgi:hypothetical protein
MVCRLGVAVIALLSACQRDYPFHTVAVYEAPRGHYSIRIEGQGVVRAGHDMSQQSFGLLRCRRRASRGLPIWLRSQSK